jgi:FkbM family methyltransferase
METYSQYNQDKFVIETLNNKKNGYFVEIGSTNGIDINNTFLLEKKFQWNGICIEPNKNTFNELVKNRDCICLCEVIDDEEKDVWFKINSDWSCITNTFSENTEKRKTKTLHTILKENNAPNVIDYLSIDCEGKELDILKSINHNEFIFNVITVEHNAFYVGKSYKNEIKDFLESKNYVFIKTNTKNKQRSEWVENIDDFYIHKNLLKNNINSIVPNSVIFYLINNNPTHIKRLQNSLKCLQKNFLNKYPYPVIFGHENIDESTKQLIRQHAPTNHYFYNISFKIPDYSENILKQIPERFKGHWDENAFFSLGYRHMCRLFAGDIYKHDFFSNVKYLLRIDCDSYFTDNVSYDIFGKMLETKSYYGTVGVEYDMDYVVEGLQNSCKEFFKEKYDFTLEHNRMYQTHFDLVDVQWIKNSEYMKFFDFMDKTGNIYIKRWGDAPIKYQGIKNILNDNEIYLFDDLPYKHGGDL